MRILFFIVGVGAGNTTRNLAILSELERRVPGVELHVAAQGRALELLRERYETHPLCEVTYTRDGAFSPMRIVTSNLSFPKKFMQNRGLADDLLRRLRPNLAVADSDFYCLGPARRRGVRLASINNSAAVVSWINQHGVPQGCQFTARFIERTDYWLQRRYPNVVVCPVLEPVTGLAEKFRQIPPIVRPDFVPTADRSGKVVVVTGGSGIGTGELDLRSVSAPIITFGSILRNVPAHAEQRGFDLEAAHEMARASVLVVQGGFSSVSEAVALRRPTVVVPIARHAEQFVNGATMESLGFGQHAKGADAGSAVNRLLEILPSVEARIAARPALGDGAAAAAQIIAEAAG